MTDDGPLKVCVWCGLPKFGPERCICDSPKFELMEACEECGEYTDIDHLREADGKHVCSSCEVDLIY